MNKFLNADVPTPAAQKCILSFAMTHAQDPPKTIGELIDEVERIREDLLRLQLQLEKLEIVDTAVSGNEQKEA
jgi:hypothetical protein